MDSRAAELIDRLRLEPHPEGGFYRRVFRSTLDVLPGDGRGQRAALTTIYYLLTRDTFSRWHQVMSNEAWHLYEGAPVDLLELDAACTELNRYHLATIGEAEGEPLHVVAAGQWQAARSLGAYSLLGCSVGPGFDFADFRLMADDDIASAAVLERWSDVADLI
ncbi:MAG TPA: cupin domain-containing protein [Gemmatimonadaceae bacterium]